MFRSKTFAGMPHQSNVRRFVQIETFDPHEPFFSQEEFKSLCMFVYARNLLGLVVLDVYIESAPQICQWS
jgi:hypothetical protein